MTKTQTGQKATAEKENAEDWRHATESVMVGAQPLTCRTKRIIEVMEA